jgi:4a-hydroxytetrahydrobiopterin dehydratase
MSLPLPDRHCTRDAPPLDAAGIDDLIGLVNADWSLAEHDKRIRRTFRFSDYYQTIAFVNALAWVAHREDHHPDLAVGYNHCSVTYSTHSVGGLSENDFICAARIDALVAGGS